MGEQPQPERKIGELCTRTSSTYQSWTSWISEGHSRSRPQQSAWYNIHTSPVKKIRTFTSKRSLNFVKHSTWTEWLKIKWGKALSALSTREGFAMVLLSISGEDAKLGHIDEGLYEGILLTR
jgi:hypothetical protein